MRRSWLALPFALLVLVFVPRWVSGDSPTWVFVRDSAGEISFLAGNGQRLGVPIYPMEPSAVDAIPHSGRYLVPNADSSGFTPGLRPEWDATAVSPGTSAAGHANWAQVGQWSGRSDRTTEPFTVSSSQWRITYTVKLLGGTFPQVCIVANRVADGRRAGGGCYRESDTTYIYAPAGIYYLEIDSSDEWRVTVEERR